MTRVYTTHACSRLTNTNSTEELVSYITPNTVNSETTKKFDEPLFSAQTMCIMEDPGLQLQLGVCEMCIEGNVLHIRCILCFYLKL